MTERKITQARRLRRTMTEPEWLMWERLKTRRNGLVFRRQHPLGPYILDFYCFKARLCVEVDGAMHGTPQSEAKDLARDAYLAGQGLKVYRLPASDVYRDADAAADGVWLLAESIVGEA